MLGVFWKIQELCSKMCTRILKIALKMTEIIDLKVGNPLYKEAKSAIKMILPTVATIQASTSHVYIYYDNQNDTFKIQTRYVL